MSNLTNIDNVKRPSRLRKTVSREERFENWKFEVLAQVQVKHRHLTYFITPLRRNPILWKLLRPALESSGIPYYMTTSRLTARDRDIGLLAPPGHLWLHPEDVNDARALLTTIESQFPGSQKEV